MTVLSCSLKRPLRGVNFILTDSKGRVLIQKRCSFVKQSPNAYCIPGGRIEHESPVIAMVREMKEETGFKPDDLSSIKELFDLEYTMDGVTYFNRFFLCKLSKDNPDKEVFSFEGDMVWMTANELIETDLVHGENQAKELILNELALIKV